MEPSVISTRGKRRNTGILTGSASTAMRTAAPSRACKKSAAAAVKRCSIAAAETGQASRVAISARSSHVAAGLAHQAKTSVRANEEPEKQRWRRIKPVSRPKRSATGPSKCFMSAESCGIVVITKLLWGIDGFAPLSYPKSFLFLASRLT